MVFFENTTRRYILLYTMLKYNEIVELMNTAALLANNYLA